MPSAQLTNSGQIYPRQYGGGSGLDYRQASAGVGDYFTPLAPFGASPDGIGRYYGAGAPQPRQVNSGSLSLGGSPLLRALKTLRGLGDDTPAVDPTAAPAVAAPATALTPVTPVATPTVPGTLQPTVPVVTGAAAAPAVASAVLLAVVAVDLALCGIAGYFVGKAVAPSAAKEQKYALWGVAAGIVGGPLGLGVEAIVALNHKGDR